MTERAVRVLLKYHPYIWNASVYSAVRFSMTADVENEHGDESLHLNILYCEYWSINTLFYVRKNNKILHVAVPWAL